MLTIFYSTRKENKDFYKTVEKSLKSKDCEIIEFVNSGTHSLAEAYNIGLDQSENNIVVFIHDDVFLERGWDLKILKHFETTDYGILGVAGSTDLEESGKWWENTNRMLGTVHHYNNNKWYPSQYSDSIQNYIFPTVMVDGLFIAVNKERIVERFDESFKGFHFYDVPFCVLNHQEGVKIGVTTDFKVKHKSVGQVNNEWELNRIQFVEKFEDILPLRVKPPIFVEDKKVKIKKFPITTIIIPTKNNFDYLERCINSLKKSKYFDQCVLIVADTGSDDAVLRLTEQFLFSIDNSKLIKYDYYHFSKINNDVVKNHVPKSNELLLFCNDDIEMLNDAIGLMVETYLKNKRTVGTIGCRLHFEDNSVQHGGIELFHVRNSNQIGVTHVGIHSYYRASHQRKNVFGNTAAFMLIKQSIFKNIGGFTEKTLECFEDVVLNLECLMANRINIYVGDAVAYHFESVSRGKDPEKDKRQGIDMEKVFLPKLKKSINKVKRYIKVI